MRVSEESVFRSETSKAELREVFLNYGGPQGQSLIEDPKLFKITFDLLKAIAQPDLTKKVLSSTQVATSGAKLAAQYSGNKNAIELAGLASMSFNTFKTSLDMAVVFKFTSPVNFGIYLTAATIQKVGFAFTLMGSDDDKYKCAGAMAELAGALTVTTLAAPTGVLLILSFASLAASAVNTHNVCKKYLP